MLIRRPADIRPSEITSESNFLNRRQFLSKGIAAGAAFVTPAACGADIPSASGADIGDFGKSRFSTTEEPNSWEDITTYNNFYEFGFNKADPHRNAQDMRTRPWTIDVSGEADKTGTFDLEDFIKPFDLEERIYRMRCVEAWSMVIPWIGISLADVVKHLQPNSNAKYVAFESLADRDQMPGVRRGLMDWPYREGLTIAEATNPLPILAVGIYGKVMPNQNGAPIRLVVPWKYGFKGIKSIVKIHFTSREPETSWNLAAPNEYGFYANVNPNVSHPRWSQARERRIGAGLFADKQETLMFNGYGEQVAHLYDGLDLRHNF